MSAGFWTFDRVAAALGEGPRGTGHIRGISTDTRTIALGDLFVALKGERFDAHDYLETAVSAGAAALVVSSSPRIASVGVPVYRVDDTLTALGRLARFWRDAWGKPVVAVAGSNGKTSTKDLIRAALGARLDVNATAGSLNNRIGVPLTLLGVRNEADIAVIELGSSLPGEVGLLREISRPDISVVTSVAEEHLEGLGDLEGVLREETACYDGVELAVAPAGQPEIVRAAREKARNVVTAGLDDGDVRPSAWRLAPDGQGELEIDGVLVRPPLRGAHNLRNTMLALAVSRACGISISDSAAAIAQVATPKMRTSWEQLEGGRATIINDAYNSNPGSARAAIDVLKHSDGQRQRVIVLGTMREMGPKSAALHDEIAKLAVESGADVVAGIGEFATALQRVGPARSKIVYGDDVETVWPLLEPLLEPDAVILLKASRGVKLERLIPYLNSWAAKC